MPISNDNSYFQNRIEERDPVLILKKDQGKYSRYSRICESSARRQPVILTDAQLEKINKEHKGFLRDEDVIKYGSDKDKQLYIEHVESILKLYGDKLELVFGINIKKILILCSYALSNGFYYDKLIESYISEVLNCNLVVNT